MRKFLIFYISFALFGLVPTSGAIAAVSYHQPSVVDYLQALLSGTGLAIVNPCTSTACAGDGEYVARFDLSVKQGDSCSSLTDTTTLPPRDPFAPPVDTSLGLDYSSLRTTVNGYPTNLAFVTSGSYDQSSLASVDSVSVAGNMLTVKWSPKCDSNHIQSSGGIVQYGPNSVGYVAVSMSYVHTGSTTSPVSPTPSPVPSPDPLTNPVTAPYYTWLVVLFFVAIVGSGVFLAYRRLR